MPSHPIHTELVKGAQTLRRGLAVLRLLAQAGPGGLRMLEITRKLELNKTTIIRLTRTLLEEGFLVHDMRSGRYRLGPDAYAVGLAAESSYELQRIAAPSLKALATETGDTVFFSTLHGYESICLSRDEGDFPIKNRLINVGDRWPLGVGAGATALLASLSDDEVTAALAATQAIRAKKFPRCTDEAIWLMLRQTRETGYCLHPGLVLEDSWAIGVVIHDANQRPIAAISLAAIKSRLQVARAAAIGNKLLETSVRITQLVKDSV